MTNLYSKHVAYVITLSNKVVDGAPAGGMWVCGLDWAGPGQGQLADACECGNEPSDSTKCAEFLDQLQISQRLKEDSAPWSE